MSENIKDFGAVPNYPIYRFHTKSDAEAFMRGDTSKPIPNLVDGAVNPEWENAPFEIQYLTRKSGMKIR